MSTATQLLAAVIAEPEEDTPRLVFADYFEENDQPERAEFIRLQCDLARLPDWELRAKILRHRMRVLLATHGSTWRHELPKIPGLEWGAFERGFVNSLRVRSIEAFAKHSAQLQAAAPLVSLEFLENSQSGLLSNRIEWLRRVRFCDRNGFNADQFQAFLNSVCGPKLHTLDLSGVGAENAGAEAITRAKHLTGLQELNLSDCFVGVAGVTALVGAKHLANLRDLRFSSYGSGYVEDPFLNSEGVELLASKESELRNLQTLEIGQNQINAEAFRSLLISPTLAKLERVGLRYCELPDEFMHIPPGVARWKSLDISGYRPQPELYRTLLSLPQTESLVRLRAVGGELNVEQLQSLSSAPFAAELRELYLAHNNIGADGIRTLSAGSWPNLHTLDLRGNAIKSDGVRSLSQGHFPVLYQLRLDENELRDNGAKAIADAKWSGSVRRLFLANNGITTKGAAALAASSNLRQLTELDLANNKIESEGAKALALANWPDLTDLDLKQANTEDAGVRALADSGTIAHLLTLRLDQNNLTDTAVRAIAHANPSTLQELWLSNNKKLGSASLAVLAEPSNFPALCMLWLSYCDLEANDLERFANSEIVSQLRRLQVFGNKTSRQLHERLNSLQWGDMGPDWIVEDVETEQEW